MNLNGKEIRKVKGSVDPSGFKWVSSCAILIQI